MHQFEAYENELRTIHSVLRRSMNQIIKFAPQIRSEKDKKDFAFYVYAFTYLLDFHHTDEDDLVFPLWEAKGIDMQSFKDEHVVYHKIIQELKSISQGPVGEFSAQQVQELCLQLKATLTPHLKAEEQLSNRATFERHGFTGQDLDNLTAQILEKVKLQDRSIILPLILFQITPFEYENFVGLKFPWILRKVIFPFVIAPKHKDSWRFCWNDPRITTPSEFSSMEEYCTDLTVIHNTLRRSINQLIINAPLVAASNQADVTDYLQFMHAVLYFLHSHHSNEDDIIFPVMAAHGIDIAVFKKDQKVLADILHNLQEIGASQFNLSTTLPLLESLKTQVVSRFQAEEDRSTVAVLEDHGLSLQTLTKMHADIMTKVQKEDGSLVLPILFFNVDEKEHKSFIESRFPWILRKIVFPFFIAKKHASAWRFAYRPPSRSAQSSRSAAAPSSAAGVQVAASQEQLLQQAQ